MEDWRKKLNLLNGKILDKSNVSDNMLIANNKLSDNLAFSNKMALVQQQRLQNENYLGNLKAGIKNRSKSYQKEVNSNPLTRKKISDSLKGVPKSDTHKQKVRDCTTNKYTNENYVAAHLAGLKKRDRQFVCGEHGIFNNRSEAARFLKELGYKNCDRYLEGKTKNDPTNYYFIEKKIND